MLHDITRAPVGRVQDVLLAPDTLEARWLQVTLEATGHTVLVPAGSVSEFAPGELLAPYAGDTISSAVHDAGAALGETEAGRLRRHFGFDA
jgi:hypothetical protein